MGPEVYNAVLYSTRYIKIRACVRVWLESFYFYFPSARPGTRILSQAPNHYQDDVDMITSHTTHTRTSYNIQWQLHKDTQLGDKPMTLVCHGPMPCVECAAHVDTYIHTYTM